MLGHLLLLQVDCAFTIGLDGFCTRGSVPANSDIEADTLMLLRNAGRASVKLCVQSPFKLHDLEWLLVKNLSRFESRGSVPLRYGG